MKKINILSLIAAVLFMAGCDYNDKYFSGYDSAKITDVADYEGAFTGEYPAEGYFTDKVSLETAISKMLKDSIKYADKGYTAKISVMYGDVTPGYSYVDASYTLTEADYKAMGEENGQPGKYNNFDSSMDVDGYLEVFCGQKYSSFADGKIVSITYKYYASGAATNQTNSYQKTPAGWEPVEFDSFAADVSYALVTEDYDSMGTESGKPGRYDNFDANMDIDMYLSTFLRMKYPYVSENQTAEVSYLYYANSTTSTQSRIYRYNGVNWSRFDPFADIVDISTKIAEMESDGTNWVLQRLMGGTRKYILTRAEYTLLLNWAKMNKPAYLSTVNDYEEFYFGSAVATNYANINNNYNTWKNSYNINGEYDGKDNDALQAIMDERLAYGIANVILPELFPDPDPGLSYQITYEVYQGRGAGDYMMSFTYDEEDKAFELTGNVIKQ